MNLDNRAFLKTFEKNFKYEIVDTPLGLAVKMPPRDAMVYSNVTGALYLDNPVYPFTLKGLTKIFYNAFDYKFVTGLFDNLSFRNTPLLLSRAKKYLIDGDKYILPVEFSSESDLQEILNKKYSSVPNPFDFIIQRIETRKKGYGMEPFMEFLAAEYFKSKGYIVETQIPLTHSTGSPDFGGYGLSLLNSEESKSIGDGFHLIELALIRLFPEQYIKGEKILDQTKIVVGEAKTSCLTMTQQLEKYLNTGIFDQGFEIHPFKLSPSEPFFGLISLSDKYEMIVKYPEKDYRTRFADKKSEYINWLNNYLKFYLMANLDNDEFDKYFTETNHQSISKQEDIIKFVNKISISDLIHKIKKISR